VEESKKNCGACAHSYMGPSDNELVCGHPDAGGFGRYTSIAAEGRLRDGSIDLSQAHCGPDRLKFEQHPLRNEDGSLKPG